jgi:hypothetical protein
LKFKIVKKAKKKEVVLKPPTLRQSEVIAIAGNRGKSKADILRKAGYSPSTVDNPKRVFNSPVVQKEMDKVLVALMKERDAIIKEMIKKRNRAQYKDLGGVLDKILGKIELLGGRPTDRVEEVLPEDEQRRLMELFDNHK